MSANYRETDAPTENHKKERAAPMERHLQTAFGAVLIGLVFWVGTTLSTAETQMAVLDERVGNLTLEVTALRGQIRPLPPGRCGA
jgi:hypothetical protein